MNYKERLENLSEDGNMLPLDKFIQYYKNIYRVGDCKAAAMKVAQRVKGFRAVELDITPFDKISAYIGKHWVATNGNQVVDLTAPDYFKLLIQNKIGSDWHKQNMNNVLFNMNVDRYEEKFKDIK